MKTFFTGLMLVSLSTMPFSATAAERSEHRAVNDYLMYGENLNPPECGMAKPSGMRTLFACPVDDDGTADMLSRTLDRRENELGKKATIVRDAYKLNRNYPGYTFHLFDFR